MSSTEELKVYYQRLFPFKEMFGWLNYCGAPSDYFLRREFSFTLRTPGGDDIYTRYKSYGDLDSFTRDIKSKNPSKIDIGAVYSVSPKDKHSYSAGGFIPLEKELVFDIDMTDYDDIRTCCSGANICNNCWTFMTVAIGVLDTLLRADFGFQQILWVYSGRRGIHCWVCDSRARLLSSEARSAVVHYISVIAGGDGKLKKVDLGATLHPALKRAYETVLLPVFEGQILEDQKLLETSQSWEKVLALISHDPTREALSKNWASTTSSAAQKWADLKATVNSALDKKLIKGSNPIHDIVFTYTYPRLDINVSHGLNHLLKSPFCIHPGTGRVCVPIDPRNCKEFNPLEVPTVTELIKEIDDYDKESPQDGAKSLQDYKKTRMNQYIQFFKTQFLQPLHLSIKKETNEQNDGDTAVPMDF